MCDLQVLVPDEGIEPPTFGLQNRCSTAELIRHNGSRYGPRPSVPIAYLFWQGRTQNVKNPALYLEKFQPDPLITNQVLYQLS
jgi:hypothetical protein